MRRTRVLMIAAVSMLGLLGVVSVEAAPPGLQSMFYGTVHVHGQMPLSTAEVVAYVGGVEAGRTEIGQVPSLGATYTLDVSADDPETTEVEGGAEGDSLRFVVELPGDIAYTMVQTAKWRRGTATPLDLSSPLAVLHAPCRNTISGCWDMLSPPSDEVR